MKTEKHIDENLLDKIIKTAYGDASIFEKSEVYIKIFSNPEIKKIYAEYKSTARKVHSIKLENIELNNLPVKKKSDNNLIAKTFAFFTQKPVNISFASIVLVLGITVFFLLVNKNNDLLYTQNQLLQAEHDFKYSLAVIGKVFNETEKKLNEDILNNKIRKPIKIGFQTINTLYN